MARRKDSIAEAGFERVEGSKARRYRDPSGKEVSYREAFKRATGRSLEAATVEAGGVGTFRDIHRLIQQTRRAAQLGLLTQADLATPAEERRLAKVKIRPLLRHHYPSESTKAGMRHETVEESRDYALFRKVALDRLQSEVKVVRRPGEPYKEYSQRVTVARYSAAGRRLNGPNSEKAFLLVVLGRRAPEAEYSVGDTP